MDEKVKENDSWKDEFMYLFHNKILSRGELGYLFSQIKQLLSEKEKKIEGLERKNQCLTSIEEQHQLDISIIKHLEEQLRISREAHADTMNGQAKRITQLEKGIKELIAYDMPKHIEEGLYNLLKKE